MSEPLAYYGADAGALSGMPEPMRPVLAYVSSHPRTDAGAALLHFVASLVHPDFVCNLALLDQLPAEARDAMLIAFEHCLSQGLTIEEQGAVLAWVQPRLSQLPGVPSTH